MSTPASKVQDIVKSIRVAMMFTHAPGAAGDRDKLHGRPMYTYLDNDTFYADLWFMTDINSAKTMELERNPDVVLSYADAGRNLFLTIRGRATLMHDRDKIKEFWNIHAQAWFPGGVDDPNLGLLRVSCSEAEYWEGPSKIVYALSVAKAVVLGEAPNIETAHEKVVM